MLIILWDRGEEYLMEMDPNYASKAPVCRVILEGGFVLTGKTDWSRGIRVVSFFT